MLNAGNVFMKIKFQASWNLYPGSQLGLLDSGDGYSTAVSLGVLINEDPMTSGHKPPDKRPLALARAAEGLDADEEINLMMTGPVDSPSSSSTPGMDGKLQAQLGQTLKAMFDQVAQAPMPEKFLELLIKLDVEENRE